MHLLKNKKALITGGTAGIGKEIALSFAKQGASVAIFGTSPERSQEVLEQLNQNKIFPEQDFRAYVVNVSDKAAIEESIGQLLAVWGNVDILVNNAGITRDGLLMKMSEEDWDQVIDVNLKSVYNTCQTLIRSMIKAKTGKIVNISSVVGITGNAGQANYAASKSGIFGFTKALAQEVATRGICVNCIAPGFIETRMTDVLTENQKEEILRKIPMKRMGQPQDIAHAALFFASDQSGYITGQVLTVDGGMVM
ncbi:MAG TPA: 3-oxoacyl-ACP reductase FabG [Rhabdochlamydiaceae bacterium]|nr:3-oxoacyl-ACP reductase FabG [Rhabdochlamydiaceae bacterium]